MASKKSGKSISHQPPTLTRDDDRKWRAENALSDIMRAEEHKKNASLMRDVRKCAQEKQRKLEGVVKGKK